MENIDNLGSSDVTVQLTAVKALLSEGVDTTWFLILPTLDAMIHHFTTTDNTELHDKGLLLAANVYFCAGEVEKASEIVVDIANRDSFLGKNDFSVAMLNNLIRNANKSDRHRSTFNEVYEAIKNDKSTTLEQLVTLCIHVERLDLLSDLVSSPVLGHDAIAILEKTLHLITKTELHSQVMQIIAANSSIMNNPENIANCVYEAVSTTHDFSDIAARIRSVAKQSPAAALQITCDLAIALSQDKRRNLAKLLTEKVEGDEEGNRAAADAAGALQLDIIPMLNSFVCRARNAYDVGLYRASRSSGRAGNRYYKQFRDNAIVVSSSLASARTADLDFFKSKHWMRSLSEWNQFGVVSAMGPPLLQLTDAGRHRIESYLPFSKTSGLHKTAPYACGGGLVALGYLYFDLGLELGGNTLEEYLLKVADELEKLVDNGSLEKHELQALQAGLVMCIGLAYFGCGYNAPDMLLQTVLTYIITGVSSNEVVYGSYAITAAGLLLAGTGKPCHLPEEYQTQVGKPECSDGDEEITELIALIFEGLNSEHGKLREAAASALAIIFQACPQANVLAHKLYDNRQVESRVAAMRILSTVNVGSGSEDALAFALRAAGSDTADSVREAAALSVGFILCRDADRLVRSIRLLHDSHNSHTRVGAALALGVGAPKLNAEAVSILEAMLFDEKDVVRQSALMSIALLHQTTNGRQVLKRVEERENESERKRNLIVEKFGDASKKQEWEKIKQLKEKAKKHGLDRAMLRNFITSRAGVMSKGTSDPLTDTGSILAMGILGIGGNNCMVSLSDSPTGAPGIADVSGILLGTTFPEWTQNCLFLSLAARPHAVMAIDRNMIPLDLSGESRPIVDNLTTSTDIEENTEEIRKEMWNTYVLPRKVEWMVGGAKSKKVKQARMSFKADKSPKSENSMDELSDDNVPVRARIQEAPAELDIMNFDRLSYGMHLKWRQIAPIFSHKQTGVVVLDVPEDIDVDFVDVESEEVAPRWWSAEESAEEPEADVPKVGSIEEE